MERFADIPVIAREFLYYLETVKGRTSKTVNEYHVDLRTFFRYVKCIENGLPTDDLSNIDVSELGVEILRNVTLPFLYEYMFYISRVRENSARARARKASSLRIFFKYLHTNRGLLEKNVATELDSPKLPQNLPKYLSLQESEQLLDAVDGSTAIRDYAIITLFLNCGLRLSELVGINISDIREDVIRITGKGNKERELYLNEACINAINNYLKVRPKENIQDRQALFISKKRKRISAAMVQHIVKRTLAAADLDATKYSCHKLRHTAATLLYNHGGVDVRLLQNILGHEQLSTTQIYTHVQQENLRTALQQNPLSSTKMR